MCKNKDVYRIPYVIHILLVCYGLLWLAFRPSNSRRRNCIYQCELPERWNSKLQTLHINSQETPYEFTSPTAAETVWMKPKILNGAPRPWHASTMCSRGRETKIPCCERRPLDEVLLGSTHVTGHEDPQHLDFAGAQLCPVHPIQVVVQPSTGSSEFPGDP